MSNIILSSDSYKYSMHLQYPPNTEIVYSYIESRGGEWKEIVYFGLQLFLKKYLIKPITIEDINEAEEVITAHGEPFNREGWEHILYAYNGRLPVIIKAIDEGSVISHHDVILTIENTDPKCFWLTTFLETALLRAIWYPTTVATNSYQAKKIIAEYLNANGDINGLPFKLHDFGARGASSSESAMIGGAAHLVNFMGTDTVESLTALRRYYGAGIAGFSIPAAEHSTITSWGRENEVDAYRNMLQKFAKPGSLVAVVSDSYNIFDACRLWGTELKQEVIDSGATVIIRPDSGDPELVVAECIKILDNHFGSTLNSKGFRVLNNVRLIQGDGVNLISIQNILWRLSHMGYSADNIAFGMGGALLQQINRDTLKFAMKCSSIRVDGEWRDVYKQPVHDKGKESKRGRFDGPALIRFMDGHLYNQTNFKDVRERAAI